MKKKGCKCDYIKERNENLKREFLARLGKNGRNISQVIESLSPVSADRFYINEERATEEIKRLRNKEKMKTANPRRQAMIREIKKRVDMMMDRNPQLSLKEAVCRVVNSPAPAFYLTPGTIRTIVYQTVKEANC